MDLIDRYLDAVGFWLPKDRKTDILEELAEDIRSEKEEREAGLGRPLAKPEVEALLRSRGRPFQTAGRYLPPRHLIGPTLFPMYLLALRIAAWIGLGVAVVLPLALAYLLPSRSASPAAALTRSLSSLWTLALTWFALITIGFAVAERSQGGFGAAKDWDPNRLPPGKDSRRTSRASSLAEIIFGALVLSWWLGASRLPGVIVRNGEPLEIAGSPLWSALRGQWIVPIALILLAGISLAVADLVRPQLSRWRIGLRALVDGAMAGLLTFILLPHKGEIQASFKGLRSVEEGLSRVSSMGDWILANILLAIALGSLVSCAIGLVRLFRRRTAGGPEDSGSRDVQRHV